jgi:thiol:disulfide interchange protein
MGLVVIGAMIYMIVRTFSITKIALRRLAVVGLAIVMSFLTISGIRFLTRSVEMVPYTPAAYDDAIASGKTVVIDFTAEWCFNCKALEAAVLSREDVQKAFNADGVIVFRADLTAETAPGWKRLQQDFKQAGIPYLNVRGPGNPIGWGSNAYTPTQVIDAINQAKGAKTASR